MSMSTKVIVQFNGTEVWVKLPPNSTAKVFIDGAEFDIRPTRHVRPDPVQTGFYMKQEDARRRLRGMCWCKKELPVF